MPARPGLAIPVGLACAQGLHLPLPMRPRDHTVPRHVGLCKWPLNILCMAGNGANMALQDGLQLAHQAIEPTT